MPYVIAYTKLMQSTGHGGPVLTHDLQTEQVAYKRQTVKDSFRSEFKHSKTY